MDVLEQLSHAQRQRLQFIESIAQWEGRVGRQRVATLFEVSENHITRDIRLYREHFPENLEYDVSARSYRPSRRFKPRIGTGNAAEYLALLRLHADTEQAGVVPVPGVTATTLPRPQVTYDANVLREVTRAISAGGPLAIEYQSLTREGSRTRRFWPRSLVYTGLRWHTRGFDEARGVFLDMNLMRMLSAKGVDAAGPAPGVDIDWDTVDTLEVLPAKSLSSAQQAVIAREFGMRSIKGRVLWEVRLRRCLAWYFIRSLRLDLSAQECHPLQPLEADVIRRYKFSDRE